MGLLVGLIGWLSAHFDRRYEQSDAKKERDGPSSGADDGIRMSLCDFAGATPSDPSVVRGSLTGDEADAELIDPTGREEMQVVDHAVVTALE